MNKALSFGLVFVLTLLGTFAQAQDTTGPGRPDPTSRGRYVEYGKEVSYPGATILKDLPTGTKCAPAGELVGVPLMNTTHKDKAIVSILTDKAEVAVVGNRTFLCHCAGGFNELFLKAQPVPAQSLAQTANTVIETDVRVGGRVQVDHTGQVDVVHHFPESMAEGGSKKSHKKRNFVIGGVATAVVTVVVIAITGEDPRYLNGTSKDVTKCQTTSGKFTCK